MYMAENVILVLLIVCAVVQFVCCFYLYKKSDQYKVGYDLYQKEQEDRRKQQAEREKAEREMQKAIDDFEQNRSVIVGDAVNAMDARPFVDMDVFAAKKEYQDVPGIYVIHNITKDKYYIGQSKNLRRRVLDHFRGEPLYVDYVKGDECEVKVLTLNESKFPSLNPLEKVFIRKYSVDHDIYNRTRGNHNY